MKAFSLYHYVMHSLMGQQEYLVSRILEVLKPDVIYLLGASRYRRRSESIFCQEAPSAQYLDDYYFLILTEETGNKSLSDWQDQIEQYCCRTMQATVLVMKTSVFREWLDNDHPFARKVVNADVCLYDRSGINFSLNGECNGEAESKTLEEHFSDGLNKCKGFLAGVTYYKVRGDNRMAAFLLHQAAEQALRTLLETGTGYRFCGHSIDRLFRYCCMVNYKLPDVFSRNSDKDKRLLHLLNKAYIDSRYKQHYSMETYDLDKLTGKVERIQELLIESASDLIRSDKIKEAQ